MDDSERVNAWNAFLESYMKIVRIQTTPSQLKEIVFNQLIKELRTNDLIHQVS